MNFLAHAYLSKGIDQVLIGNFIGDFVKGREFPGYAAGVQEGIRLHRQIDTFTDSHPIVRRSKKILFPKYRHYAGVVVDMYYDHLLARNWDNYHQHDLLQFTDQVYTVLSRYDQVVPARVRMMLGHMIPNNWLFHYGSIEGLTRALVGMSRRTRFSSGIEQAGEDLKAHYATFEHDFECFFPELNSFVESRLAQSCFQEIE